MITIDGVTYRNLQEKVLKNANDIASIIAGNVVLGELGIKVVGQAVNVSQLPVPENYTGEYGDAFLIGTETPYDYYIFTRPFEGQTQPQWFNLGKFPVAGPQGEPGIGIAPTFTIGTVTDGENAEVTITGTNANPVLNFTIPRGRPGTPGTNGVSCTHQWVGTTLYITSASGTTSANLQGPEGPQALPVKIVGELSTVDALPTPSEAIRQNAYVVDTSSGKALFVIVGEVGGTLTWTNVGVLAGSAGSQITVNGQVVNQWNADTKVDVVVDQNIVYGMDNSGFATTYKVDSIYYPEDLYEGNVVRRINSIGDINVPANPSSIYGAISNAYFTNTLYGTYLAYIKGLIYPVGSIYISMSSTNPSTLFGGTWQQINGKFLVGVDENDSAFSMLGATGGSKDAVVVAHTHNLTMTYDTTGATYGTLNRDLYSQGSDYNNTFSIQSTGVDGTNKNLPPYIAVYIWQRIS